MDKPAQRSFDYDALDEHTCAFLQQKANEIHGLLRKTAQAVIQIGMHLHTVKERLEHGQFLLWIQEEFAMSHQTAMRFMHVAERFGADGTDKFSNLLHLSVSVIYELAAPSTSDTIIEHVQTGAIPASLYAIQEAKKAEKLAREAEQQAQVKVERIMEQLFQVQTTSSEKITQLARQIETLQQEMAALSKPERAIQRVEITPPSVLAQLETLQHKISDLTEQRNNLAEKAKQLGEEMQHTMRERAESEKDRTIRMAWQKTAREFQSAILKVLAQLPTPLDLLVFEAADWEQLTRMKELARRFLTTCDQLSNSPATMIVDAE